MKSLIGPDSDIYKSFFDFNHNASYALDSEGNFILVNDAAVDATGYEKEEILQMSFVSIMQEDCIDRAFHYFNSTLKGNRHSFDISIKHKRGHRVDLYITTIPIWRDGHIKGIGGIVKEMTESYKLETLFSGQNFVLEMIAKGSPFSDVLDRINYLVESVTKGACSILLTDETGTFLKHGSSPSLPLEYSNYIKRVPIGPKVGSCGTSAYFKRRIIVTDIASDPLWNDYKHNALKHGLRACWSSPVYDTDQQVIGVFGIYFDQANAPKEGDLQIIERATYLTSLAIQHYRAVEKINFMAFHDDLTGLPNRRLFNQRVNQAIEREVKDPKKGLALLFIDLDRFKLINDSLGHGVGDQLLREVGGTLQSCIRKQDIVARQGGDEFTILLDEVSKQQIISTSQAILEKLSQPFFICGHEIFITPSIGISLYPPDGVDAEELIRKADIAMYKVKHEGRNNFKFYEPIFDNKTNDRLELENELRKALDKEEFILHYQPIIDLSTDKLAGVEALIRWIHPQHGQVPPDHFIPIAEDTGMIVKIGEWVLRTACEHWNNLKKRGILLPTISVNISIRQFYQPNLISMIASILKETNMEPKHLTIEITESMTMDVERALTILNHLKCLGVNISIDDFGTGYSSLSYLKAFPIDFLKIDKSFIRDMPKSKGDENIATTILLMARNLGLSVIAEGVETAEQLEVLRRFECGRAQGYLFSRPLATEPLEKFLFQQKLGLMKTS
ncbi:EAL domain-containing protein [Bacillus sp. ISL-18]|uniref:bifunctional diguanylate cyclase/phosphodiesterase n=1 Tax=Bacillus sp. ISL-18 TaxID=2819118 RepID=UPI001BE51D6B|nr:EAL domain-containing protein [Bacillus sp. ISL-18]MBT2655282.1 EAL domain-containing protein [Bacillus sp. ISL-18]